MDFAPIIDTVGPALEQVAIAVGIIGATFAIAHVMRRGVDIVLSMIERHRDERDE